MLDINAIEKRYKALSFEKWIAHSLLTVWGISAADYSIRFIPATIYGNNDFRAEAEFIVHAHNHDIPELITEVRELREIIKQMNRQMIDCRDKIRYAITKL